MMRRASLGQRMMLYTENEKSLPVINRILSFVVTAHPLYKPLKLNNSFRANCSGMMPLSLLAAAIRIACS